jgi:hypothetical protein
MVVKNIALNYCFQKQLKAFCLQMPATGSGTVFLPYAFLLIGAQKLNSY